MKKLKAGEKNYFAENSIKTATKDTQKRGKRPSHAGKKGIKTGFFHKTAGEVEFKAGEKKLKAGEKNFFAGEVERKAGEKELKAGVKR